MLEYGKGPRSLPKRGGHQTKTYNIIEYRGELDRPKKGGNARHGEDEMKGTGSAVCSYDYFHLVQGKKYRGLVCRGEPDECWATLRTLTFACG